MANTTCHQEQARGVLCGYLLSGKELEYNELVVLETPEALAATPDVMESHSVPHLVRACKKSCLHGNLLCVSHCACLLAG
eukprot:1152684-Pelagomonas_calceolata.AAC.5